jgi:hypothetical protein
VRIAIDLGFNRAFEQLVQGGMGAGKTAAELEKDRALVERARVWLAVYRMEHQMSYGMGRPAIVREDSTIHNCRLLLDHPLSLGSDTRLIYAVELIALRAPLHVELTATPDLPIDAATLTRLRWAHEQFDAWEKHWDDMLVEQYGTSGFVRESLAMQRQLAELFINSQLLRGVRTVADVKALSAEKRVLALRAMHNALKCGEIALSGKHVSVLWRGRALTVVHAHLSVRHALHACMCRLRRVLSHPDHAPVSRRAGPGLSRNGRGGHRRHAGKW